MPTTTSAGTMSLNNLGALFDVYTAPSSCTTAPGFVFSGIADPENDGHLMHYVDNCGKFSFPAECIPRGGIVDGQLRDALGPDPATILNYYSPGLECPDAWETVGVYEAISQSDYGRFGDDLTSATGPATDVGVFRPTEFSNGPNGTPTTFPPSDFPANMLTSALKPLETAVVCCPRGYSADPYNGCVSHFPVTELASKKGCYLHADVFGVGSDVFEYTYEFWGKTTSVMATVTSSLSISVETPISTSTSTVTLDESGRPRKTDEEYLAGETGILGPDAELTGLAVVQPIYMIYENRDDYGRDNEDNERDDDDNSSGRLSPGASWESIGGVVAVWGVSIAAGLGLLLAW
ncbi:hypothetical protein LIA77_08941 [Sarocladium implicatum]|nr:hypothetical protein LIA77_08941 [Sarocladium implicatum]